MLMGPDSLHGWYSALTAITQSDLPSSSSSFLLLQRSRNGDVQIIPNFSFLLVSVIPPTKTRDTGARSFIMDREVGDT